MSVLMVGTGIDVDPSARPMTAPTPRSSQTLAPNAASVDVARGLVSEFQEEQRAEKALAREAEAKANRRIPQAVKLGLAGVAVAIAWFAPLPGLTPRPQEPPAEQYALASGRLVLSLAAQRINAFSDRVGRLPSSLADANVSEPGMTYQPVSDSNFVLSFPVGATVLTWESASARSTRADDGRVILQTTQR